MSLNPQDATPENTSVWGRNVRQFQNGTFEPRYGLDLGTDAAFADPPHSLFRLNDTTPYADLGAPSRRLVGSGTGLYGGSPGTNPISYSLIDPNPYSGDPFTWIAAQPVTSPRPFAYIGDSVRMRKVNSSFNDYPIGISQPLLPPTGALAAPQLTYLDTVGVAPWTTYGGNTTGFTVVARVNTTVTQLLYDSGVTGMASVVLASFENVTQGANLNVGASPETIIVHSVHPPVAPTTIAAILYDAGTTGLCTIQPTGSFSVGQIEAVQPIDIERRYRDLNLPLPPRVTITRTVDFPVDSLVLLGGVEVVRILSVAVGPDGVQSFRCITLGTFAAGAAIAGMSSLRAYFNTTKNVGDPVVEQAWQTVTTASNDTDPVPGGVQGPVTGIRNWAQVGNRATQPEDIIRFGIKVSLLKYVQSIRLTLDVNPYSSSPPDTFLKEYYFYEWRAADLVTAIQATGETATGLVKDAQGDAVDQGQINSLYTDQYGQSPVVNGGYFVTGPDGSRRFVPTTTRTTPILPRVARHLAKRQAASDQQTDIAATDPVAAGSAISRQLALGNDAWMTLECRVGDLTRVGSDTTLTLQAIQSAAVWMQILGTTTPITLEVSDVYLIGGYGPDVGLTLPPYVYRYSYRSTITGERSNPSPPMRAGVTPRRGRVSVFCTPSDDPQADQIDIWRFGGALARWEFVGTQLNEPASPATTTYLDDLADKNIDGGQPIRADLYQPWPVSDLPRSGTANVAGTAVEWVSGDLFDIRWAADSLAIVNGIATQLYASPGSSTRLEVVDNVGSGTAVAWSLPAPTILSQPLPVVFGGPINGPWVHFAVGDPSDPGLLHWSHGNDPDATSDRNTLNVTTPSEPLMNGYVDDGIPYVFSTQQLYRILPNYGGVSDFVTVPTNCTKGLWSRWAMVVDPDGGAFFLTGDGISKTAGGSDAVSITDSDMRPLFNQDGTESMFIRNMYPVDLTLPERLRLSIVGRYLYFDYVDTQGDGRTLVYDRIDKGWVSQDSYLETGSPGDPVGVTVRLSEPGPEVYDHIVGAEDGNLYDYTSAKITDVLEDVRWAYWTPWAHGDDPRAWKQWGDGILDFNPGGSINGVVVTPVLQNGNVALDPVTLGAGGILRDTFLIELTQGDGVYSRNCGLWIEGAVQACDTQRPIFYLWELSYLWKGTSVARRATDWEDLGYKGAKFIQGVIRRPE
jgi:hypothetical protein